MVHFLRLSLFALSLAVYCSGKNTKRGWDQPNIIWIFGDDYGYSDIGFRDPTVVTPNMDELATNGVILTNAYTAPQCSPSRGSLLSGRYSYKSRMQHSVILDNKPCCLGLNYRLLPNYLKDLGYETHATGKWHLGYCREECTPTGRGFDTFYGGYSGEGDYYDHITNGGAYDWHNGLEVDRSADGIHSQDLIQSHVLDVLDNYDGSSPLFFYVAFHNTHSPLLPLPEFAELYADMDATDDRKNYLGLVSGMDSAIGAIVQKVKDIGIYDNTLIIFSSDNGADVHEGNNLPSRGAKGSLWEGGCKANSWIHSPLLAETGVENNGLIHVTDWLPTLVSIAGGSVPESDGLDGLDQSDLVMNNGPSVRTNMVYNIDREYNIGMVRFGEIAVRNERYKLIWGFPGQNDGYGLDTDFIYNMQFYKDAVANFTSEQLSTDRKRGGPYKMTSEQSFVMNTYVSMVQVTDDELADGTGSYMLFDLQEDPGETTDLSTSEDPDHVSALQELIGMVQDAYANEYLHQTTECWVTSPQADPSLYDGTLYPNWCADLFPSESDGYTVP